MRLYYFEVQGDRYLGEYDYQTVAMYLSFHNAKFFGDKKSAKIWHDKFGQGYPDAVLWSFECTDWREE